MRKMGIAALGPKPNTTKPAPGHKIYPYLLRNMTIDRPNQVWAADITYLPIGRGFLYLVAIIDWASRAVLAWRVLETNGGSLNPPPQTPRPPPPKNGKDPPLNPLPTGIPFPPFFFKKTRPPPISPLSPTPPLSPPTPPRHTGWGAPPPFFPPGALFFFSPPPSPRGRAGGFGGGVCKTRGPSKNPPRQNRTARPV